MSNPPPPFHNPFSALRALRGDLPEAPPEPPKEMPPAPGARIIPRAVVRLERSGRGGKEVTVVEHLGLSATALDSWMKALKTALGCGGYVEGTSLVLQGDQRQRLPPLLASRGVKKVTVA